MKIAFCGSHGTGKSTLMDLCFTDPRFDRYKRITSISRNFPVGWSDSKTQKYVNTQYFLKHFWYRNFISARSIFDAWAYGNRNCGLTFDKTRFTIGSRLIKYDYLFYIPIEFELINDNYRPTDKLYQRKIDLEIFSLLVHNHIDFHIISGTLNERVNKINKIIYESRL